MKKHVAYVLPKVLLCLVFTISLSHAVSQPGLSGNKATAIRYIDEHQAELISLGNQIWEFAEPSLQETKSAKLLVDVLRREGFQVKEGVSRMSTVFVASFGTAEPVIGLFGEYDADPGASNKIVPRKEALVEGGYGHGGHHNLLGAGSFGAALAIKELIRKGKLNCTIKYFGTTAEGHEGAKAYLARDGYFDDLDFSLYWHPAPATQASTRPWDALIDFDVTFVAQKENVFQKVPGKSTTLDAMEMMIKELKGFRRQMSPSIRMNYSVLQQHSGLNEISDTVKFAVRIQCARQEDVLALFGNIQDAVDRVAATLHVAAKVEVNRAMHQFLPNVTATAAVHKNMTLLGPTQYTKEEEEYASDLQQAVPTPPTGIEDKISPFADESDRQTMYGYASDIGEASWFAPEVYFVVRTLPGVPMHRWPGTAFSAHAIGHKGMLKAAKILSMTIIDYVEDKSLQQSAWSEFERKRKSYRYQSLLAKEKSP